MKTVSMHFIIVNNIEQVIVYSYLNQIKTVFIDFYIVFIHLPDNTDH